MDSGDEVEHGRSELARQVVREGVCDDVGVDSRILARNGSILGVESGLESVSVI